jgi:hypothetical protein
LGLDIYVGSFTRYYSGDWELVAARVAREIGATFEVVRQHDPPDAIRDPEESPFHRLGVTQRACSVADFPICPNRWIGMRVQRLRTSRTSNAGMDIRRCCSRPHIRRRVMHPRYRRSMGISTEAMDGPVLVGAKGFEQSSR